MSLAPATDHPRVVIAGGGVAALEGCLALRERLSAADLDITLLSPGQRFDYRPLSVLQPFRGISRWSVALSTFAADQDVTIVNDALTAIAPHARVAVTGAGDEIPYDAMLVATGGHAADAVHGALTFRGAGDGQAIRELLAGTAAEDRLRDSGRLVVAPAPLRARPAERRRAAQPRRRHGGPARDPGGRAAVALRPGARATSPRTSWHATASSCSPAPPPSRRPPGWLELSDGRRLAADRVVALPRVLGRRIEGIPRDEQDFIPIDEHARVEGLSHVYAAGDVTNFPVKHGGLAAQQADAAAEAMLAEFGLPIAPRPFDPVIQGVLFTDSDPAYLQARLTDSAAAPSEPRAFSLWWPPSKIAGRHLSPYLAIRAGAPRTPEIRPGADGISVSIDARARMR